MSLRCVECETITDELPADCACPSCEGLLEVLVDPSPSEGFQHRPLGVWRYEDFLPHDPTTPPITLDEGGTRLVEAPTLADEIGVGSLHLKIEGGNPTGSFKDRGMTCAISWALSQGADRFVCASTGNTAASMAAYAARAGKPGLVLLPSGKVAAGKLAQAMAHGAQVLEVDGDFDDCMELVLDLAEKGVASLMNSKNPYRLEGQKTLVFEVLDQLETPPDRICFPVGNAGNISAAHKALVEYVQAGLLDEGVRLTGAQAEGASPLAQAYKAGASEDAVEGVAAPETIATAIRIGQPVSAIKAMRAVRETGGALTSVPDAAITDAQKAIARKEGVFCEPASATSVAGVKRLAEEGEIGPDEDVVCVLTGHGLKDPDAAQRLARDPTPVEATVASVMEAIG